MLARTARWSFPSSNTFFSPEIRSVATHTKGIFVSPKERLWVRVMTISSILSPLKNPPWMGMPKSITSLASTVPINFSSR